MGFLTRFFSKNSFLLFFLLLQVIAIFLIFSKNSVQQSWIAAQTSAFNSWVSGYIDEGTSYLKLKQTNEELVAQNKALLQEVYGSKNNKNPVFRRVYDTLGGGQIYTFVDGEIVYNSINRKNNYFTINRGTRDGVQTNMAVIAPNGIAGIVINATNTHSLAQSVLSVKNIKINAALKNSGFFGTLIWDGENPRVMHLKDIPKYAPLKIGDTIITDGKSAIFPRGIMIGKVAGYQIDKKTGFWDVSVELSAEMGTLNKVFLIKNLKKAEVDRIQDTLQATIKKEND